MAGGEHPRPYNHQAADRLAKARDEQQEFRCRKTTVLAASPGFVCHGTAGSLLVLALVLGVLPFQQGVVSVRAQQDSQLTAEASEEPLELFADEGCTDGWRYIRARDVNAEGSANCTFTYSLKFRQEDPDVFHPVINGPNACNHGVKGIRITNDGCARPSFFTIEGSMHVDGPWTVIAAAISQSWNSQVTKELGLLIPEEDGLPSVTLANVMIFSQKLRAGYMNYLLKVPEAVFIQQRQGAYGLAYIATQENGSPLPSWLKFDPVNLELFTSFVTLEGWSNFNNVTNEAGEWTAGMKIRVVALDALGTSVFIEIPFLLNWRTPPAVILPMEDSSIVWGSTKQYNISAVAFMAFQPDVTLRYNVSMVQGGAASAATPAPLPSWMTWSEETLTLKAQPTITDVGVYTIRVSARPAQAKLSDLVGYDDFKVHVQEPCDSGFRFFRVSTFSENGLAIMRCAANSAGFISFWQYNGEVPSSPADTLVPIGGSYWVQEESKPAPALIFGGESVCMYAKAVTLSLRSGLCGALYDVTIEGTNSPARTGFRTLVVVKSSSPLEFGAGTRLGNRLEFLDASLLPPEPLQRVLKSNSSNTFVCPGNSFSHYRLLPAERLLSRDLPQYRLLLRGAEGWTTPYIEGLCYPAAAIVVELFPNASQPYAFKFQASGLISPDPFLYTLSDDWKTVSIAYGGAQLTPSGWTPGFSWNPTVHTFHLFPYSSPPPPLGVTPSVRYSLPVQQVVLGAADFQYRIPYDLFRSNNVGLYGFRYFVQKSIGGRIPSWLEWNASEALLSSKHVQIADVDFSGCPERLERPEPPNFCGRFGVDVTAVDPYGVQARTTLNFQVAQNAPSVMKQIGEASTVVGTAWVYTIQDVFQRNVKEGSLLFSATTYLVHTGAVLSSLPGFLTIKSFQLVNRLEGTPGWDDVGVYEISLTATDAYGWTGSHSFTLTVTDSCADGYRYLLVDSLSTPGELFQCANADLSSFMKARVGNSLTFLTLEAPTLSPVLGARYGDGRSCLQPKAFSFLECNGIRDLTISGTTNPNGGGPFVPLVQAISNVSVDTTRVFEPRVAPRLAQQAACPAGTYSAARLRLPSGAVILGQGLQSTGDGDGEGSSGLARIHIKDSAGRVIPTAALQSARECVQPVSIAVELAPVSQPPEEFFIEMWSGAAAKIGTWVPIKYVVNQAWPSLMQTYVVDQSLALALPNPVVSSIAFESGSAAAGSPFEWRIPEGTFSSGKAGSYGYIYQGTAAGDTPLPPWLLFDAPGQRIIAPEAVAFLGTDANDRLEVVIRAMDAEGDYASFSFYLLVTATQPTQIRPLPDVVIDHLDYLKVDISNSFQANLRNPALTYSAEGIPPWAKLDPITGLLKGLPGEEGAETLSEITATATDSLGDAMSASFEIEVHRGCYEGFRYFRVMGFVSSTDSRLASCISNWGDSLETFLSWYGVDGTKHPVTVKATRYSAQLGSVFDLGLECAIPSAFKVGACAGVTSLKVEGMFRGDEPTGRKWVELVDWRTTADDPELGGQYSLIQPLTTILPPRLLVLDLSSSNTNPEVANSGDNVTLRIVASRSIYRPTVSIGGIPAILELSGDSDQGSSSFSGAQWVAYRQIIRSEGEGELDIQVEFEDLFGNVRMVDELSSGSIRVRVDSSRPTASVVAVDDVPENGGFFGPITLTRLFLLVTFSEPVSDVDESKITIDNGSISGLSQISNSTWRFQVTGMDMGAVLVAVGAGTAKDLAGNPSLPASWSAVFDYMPPEISMTYRASPHWVFNLIATDVGSRVGRFLCRIYKASDQDAGLPAPGFGQCETPFAVNKTGFRFNTELVFDFTAVDIAENSALPWSYRFLYDRSTPPVRQPSGPTPPPTTGPTPAPTLAPTQPPTLAPTQAPTPSPTKPPRPTTPAPTKPPSYEYSVPGGRAAAGDIRFQMSISLIGFDVSRWGRYEETVVREAVSLVTDTSLDRVAVLQKFGVTDVARRSGGYDELQARRRRLQVHRRLSQDIVGASTSILVAVGGWQTEKDAQDGARLLASSILNGGLRAEFSRRGMTDVDSLSYGTVQLTVVSSDPVPTPDPGQVSTEDGDSLLSDPAVLGAIIASGVVVLLSVTLLPVVAIMLQRRAEVAPADSSASPVIPVST